MRQTFDSSVPVGEQLKRIIKSAQGRKHGHRKGPGRQATDQQQKRKNIQALKSGKRRKRVAAVKAYWKGERDEHPK